MIRRVQPELLDTLPPGDPRALRSRRDLQRINRWMRNDALMAAAIRRAWHERELADLTDLGAGDGCFILRVARRLARGGVPPPVPVVPVVVATLLDRHIQVEAGTLGALTALGWQAVPVAADVFEWLESEGGVGGVAVANLFLHHFEDARLAVLLGLIASRAEIFIAIEPRRGWWPGLASRMLWAIGCNDVTRHDAVVSVRAGFGDGELAALWPDHCNWQLTEHRAGAFSHMLVARKIS